MSNTYLAKVMERILLPSKFISLVSSSTTYALENFRKGELIENISADEMLELIDAAYPFLDFSARLRRAPATYYAKISEVILSGETGMVFSVKDKSFLIESGMTYLRAVKAARQLVKRIWYVHLEGLSTSVYLHPWAKNNIYHWFIECLPRLAILAEVNHSSRIRLLAPANLPAYQRETMEFMVAALKHLRIDIEYIDQASDYKVEEYLFLPFVSMDMFGYIPSSVRKFTRSAVLKGYGLSTARPRHRIVISRSEARKRRITNEGEMTDWLVAEHDFEIHRPEHYTYQEQVALFLSADVIVSAHGAGLTNLLFCEQDTAVLELFASNKVKPHYFGLATGSALDYRYMIGSDQDKQEDFSIPMPEFKQLVSQMMQSR